ncbi:MAG: 50S ribosome-binding GTPase, partial [Firmicutes bacterium]|nr:50S ribosome-binding GTPase [Bacillota bacterium]
MPTVALIGNPNCGKTTLFNALTGGNQFVGNWPGVTVERKEGFVRAQKDLRILDLPGIYSLTPYSPEEIVARDALTGKDPPDAVLNIVDGTHLERSLYLTVQLLELGLPVVVAVNCADVLKRRGDRFSPEKLSRALGCPVAEISALKGFGLGKLISMLNAECLMLNERIRPNTLIDDEKAIAARYDYIEIAVRQCLVRSGKREFSQRVDDLLLNRWLALPIFVGVMFLVYYVSV